MQLYLLALVGATFRDPDLPALSIRAAVGWGASKQPFRRLSTLGAYEGTCLPGSFHQVATEASKYYQTGTWRAADTHEVVRVV